MSDQFTNFTPYTRSTSRKGRAFFYVAIFLALIGGAIFLGNVFLNGQAEKGEQGKVSKTPTPTPTSTPTVSASPSANATPTGRVTPTPTKKVAATLKVEVLNGSGESGVAGVLAKILEDAGYDVVSTGNADNFDYAQTTIQIKKSKNSELSALKAALSADYTLDPKVGTLAESSSSDAIVIVGAK